LNLIDRNICDKSNSEKDSKILIAESFGCLDKCIENEAQENISSGTMFKSCLKISAVALWENLHHKNKIGIISFRKETASFGHRLKNAFFNAKLYLQISAPVIAICLFVLTVVLLSNLKFGLSVKYVNNEHSLIPNEEVYQRAREKVNAVAAVTPVIHLAPPELEVTVITFSSDLPESPDDVSAKMLQSEKELSEGIGYQENVESYFDFSIKKDDESNTLHKETPKSPEPKETEDKATEPSSDLTQKTDLPMPSETTEPSSLPEDKGLFLWPVPFTGEITSGFGRREDGMHNGIDICSSGIYGQDIVASRSGVVAFANCDNSGYGYHVIIDHGAGMETLYGHCSKLYVSTGDVVAQGQVIAAVGNTGYSEGSHLHFEIILDGIKVDPLAFFT